MGFILVPFQTFWAAKENENAECGCIHWSMQETKDFFKHEKIALIFLKVIKKIDQIVWNKIKSKLDTNKAVGFGYSEA